MKLTANFSLAEMTKSETALRHDIDNTPDAEQLENSDHSVRVRVTARA